MKFSPNLSWSCGYMRSHVYFVCVCCVSGCLYVCMKLILNVYENANGQEQQIKSTMRRKMLEDLLSQLTGAFMSSHLLRECGVGLRVGEQTHREEKQSQKAEMSSYRLSDAGRERGERKRRPLKETTIFRNWFLQLQVLAGLESVGQAGRNSAKISIAALSLNSTRLKPGNSGRSLCCSLPRRISSTLEILGVYSLEFQLIR